MKRTFFAFAFLLTSCGVDKAEAPRENVEPLVLRSFPKQSWRLVNNKFFLWREDMTPQQASRAIAIGKEIDRLDGQALPLNRRRAELDAQITPVKELVRTLNKHLVPIKGNLTKATKKKTDSEKAIAIEKGKPTPDTAALAKLETALAEAKAQIAELTPVKARLEKDLDDQKAVLAPIQAELDDVEAKQLVIEEAGRKQVDEIMTVVDWFKDQPTAVTFQYGRDGKWSASISGWNLGDDAGARNFSTEAPEGRKPTMGNVTYTELGGVYEFDVYVYADEDQTQLRETYHFRVGRINYDYADGRQFFGGDITRTDAAGVVRRGQAKLVDRNN